MKSMKSLFSILVLVLFFSLVLTACRNSDESSTGSSSSTPTSTGEADVSFNLAMPSLVRQLTPSAAAEKFTPDQILRGSLYALNTDDSTNSTYEWTIYLDESDYSAQSNKTLILAPGNYEFSLLLTSGSRQYAGTAVQAIIDGENDVAMTIRPVIGEIITDVAIIDRIFDLRYQYDTAELSGITTPQLGVLIDADPTENLLTIDPSTGLTNTYISLEPGTHTLTLKFYDGSTQIGRSIPAQENVEIALGNSYTMDIVALQGETSFTLTEDGGDAAFKINIPSEVVEETGDTSNLEVLFSIAGPENPLREIILTVDPSGDAYYAEETLYTYQYDTVSLTLTFTQLSDGKQIGECINSGIVLDVNTENVNCDITLRRDGIIGGNLLATLGTNVMNTDGEPVAGATVFANGKMVGITGSGTFGTSGYLRTFLKAGSYLVSVEDDTNQTYGENNVDLSPLEINNQEVVLSLPLVDLGRGLAVQYSFDDTVDPGLDSSGQGLHALVEGDVSTDTTTKKLGSGSAFFTDTTSPPQPERGGNFVSTPLNQDLIFPGDFSISFWVYKIEDDTESYMIPVSNHGHTDNGGTNFYLAVDGSGHHYNAGSTYIHIEDAIGGIGQTPLNHVSTGAVNSFEKLLPKNIWHHVVMIRQGTSVSEYVNGQKLSGIGEFVGEFDPTQFELGNAWTGGPRYFPPIYLDEARFYNRALTSGEITALATP